MAFSIDSKVGELLDNPKTKAVLDKHIPEFAKNPLVTMARDISLKMTAGYSQGTINADKLTAIAADLSKVEDVAPKLVFSTGSRVGELLDNPQAKAVLDKHIPEFSANPLVTLARDTSLKFVAGFSNGTITAEKLTAIENDLTKL